MMKPTTLLKFEGLVIFLLCLVLYYKGAYNWYIFAAVFFLPDLFMLGYLKNNKIGSAVYNLGHTYALVIPLGLFFVVLNNSLGITICLIWAAHIGFDRFFGFGLKHEKGFKSTHLTR